MKPAMFAVGDRVRVKTLEELKRELGENMETPCNFVEEMYEYCGQIFEVKGVYRADEVNYFYDLKGGDNWSFDECVLADVPFEEPPLDFNSITMNYESLF